MRYLCFVVGILVLSQDAVSRGVASPSWLPAQREQMAPFLGTAPQLLPGSIQSSQASRSGSVTAQSVFVTPLQPVLASNGNNCASCHSTPGTGGTSNITVTRSQGADDSRNSVVLHSTDEITPVPRNSIRAERVTISIMGDSYIEAVDEGQIREIMKRQRLASNGKIAGKIARAPALEAGGSPAALGKFGWKGQHSSLLSACADSMLNELGVPNRLYSANKAPSKDADTYLNAIVAFVRSLPPPEPDRDLAATENSTMGRQVFSRIGCALCHVPAMKTLPAGTPINGGTYRVPKQLGNREFYPYSDFLLHDVGTGDGVLEAGTQEFVDPSTANRFRTPPLWGLRFRHWLMHDGKAVTPHQAIMRHAGEASDVVASYEKLTPKERYQLEQFLNSL